MKTAISFFQPIILLPAVFMLLFSLPISAQKPGSTNIDAQREAMRKLLFLSGHWSGPVTIVRGTGEPLHLTQSEDVEYKLNGLVLLIEGKTTNSEGKVLFNALAAIAYDEASGTYRFRAYNDGRYLDTELSVSSDGFSWSFTAGQAHIVNTMHLTDIDGWKELTEVAVNGNPPHRSMEMLLRHQP